MHMTARRLRRPISLASSGAGRLPLVAGMILALVIAGCAAGEEPGWTFAPPQETPPPANGAPTPDNGAPTPDNGAPPPANGEGNVIELEMTTDLRYAQDGQTVTELRFTVGEEYTFRVDNVAGFEHDIFLGPPDRLAAGDTDGLPGIAEWREGVEEFTWTATAEADGWQFACTVPGHYQAGMHGEIVLDSE